MKIKIGGILEMSTVDYTGKISSVVFFCGCNFRCPFCHNVSLVTEKNCKKVEVEKVIEKIKKFRGFIDAVVITGGEPTLQSAGLEELVKGLKDLKLLVKLDTNGSMPDVVKRLVPFLDFISLDVKSSPEKYPELSGTSPNLNDITKTMSIVKKSGVSYEFRTTIVPGLNDKEEDMKKICSFIGRPMVYVLQQFRADEGTLDPKFSKKPKTDRNVIQKLGEVAKNLGLTVKIRTEEDGEAYI